MCGALLIVTLIQEHFIKHNTEESYLEGRAEFETDFLHTDTGYNTAKLVQFRKMAF